MTRSRLLPAVIALLAITSLSVASTTLETSLTTDPEDEINPDWETLPIGQDDAAAIQESIGGDGDENMDEGGETGTSGADDGGPDDREDVGGEERDDVGGEEADGGDDGSENGDAAAGSENQGGNGDGADDGMGSAGGEQSLFDRLAALMSLLLRYLLPLVGFLAVVGLAYRYRAILFAIVGSESETDSDHESQRATDSWPGAVPKNDVDWAWVQLLSRLDPEHPETITPDECRALARSQDLDRAGTESIASAFERVHYGGHSIDAEVDRARDGLRALEGGAT